VVDFHKEQLGRAHHMKFTAGTKHAAVPQPEQAER
jgi:hypothetical protein